MNRFGRIATTMPRCAKIHLHFTLTFCTTALAFTAADECRHITMRCLRFNMFQFKLNSSFNAFTPRPNNAILIRNRQAHRQVGQQHHHHRSTVRFGIFVAETKQCGKLYLRRGMQTVSDRQRRETISMSRALTHSTTNPIVFGILRENQYTIDWEKSRISCSDQIYIMCAVLLSLKAELKIFLSLFIQCIRCMDCVGCECFVTIGIDSNCKRRVTNNK